MPFDDYTDEDFQALSRDMNRSPKLNIERLAENLRRAANAAEVIGEVVSNLSEAKKNNPRGLIF